MSNLELLSHSPSGVLEHGQSEFADAVAHFGTGHHDFIPENAGLEVVPATALFALIFHWNHGYRLAPKMLFGFGHNRVSFQKILSLGVFVQNIFSLTVFGEMREQELIEGQNVHKLVGSDIQVELDGLLLNRDFGRVENHVPDHWPTGASVLQTKGSVRIVVVILIVSKPHKQNQVGISFLLRINVVHVDDSVDLALGFVQSRFGHHEGILDSDFRGKP